MVAAQKRVQTLFGTDNSTKGKSSPILLVTYTWLADIIASVATVETAIHHAKQPQLLGTVSMIESFLF
jgi:hypothetical protein